MCIRDRLTAYCLLPTAYFLLPMPMPYLGRAYLLVATLWLGVWLAFYTLLRPTWPYSGRWLALSGVILAYELWTLWRNLPANHRPGESALLPSLGPGLSLIHI